MPRAEIANSEPAPSRRWHNLLRTEYREDSGIFYLKDRKDLASSSRKLAKLGRGHCGAREEKGVPVCDESTKGTTTLQRMCGVHDSPVVSASIHITDNLEMPVHKSFQREVQALTSRNRDHERPNCHIGLSMESTVQVIQGGRIQLSKAKRKCWDRRYR
jgi:hypothetical protein